MYRMRFFTCILLGSLLSIPPVFAFQKQQPEYKRLFKKADKLSNAVNHTDETDARALKTYNQVIDILTVTKTDPVFLLKAYVSTGAFLQVLGRPKESIGYFKNAFTEKSKIPA